MGGTMKQPGELNAQTISAFMPGLSVDNVIFGFHDNQLKVLLLEAPDRKNWMLPGGFVLKDESVDAAAEHVLFNRTGLKKVYLRQFGVFGDPDRSREHLTKEMMRSMHFGPELSDWLLQRFITIGYYALVEFNKVKPVPDQLSVSCAWFDTDKLPQLIFDHKEIIKAH